MTLVNVSAKRLDRVLSDVELLVEDVASLLNLDETARKRLAEIKADPDLGGSEEELDDYLASRGAVSE